MVNKYLFYFLTILFISLPTALFEIFIEKEQGWGSGWSKDMWYAQNFSKGKRLFKYLHVAPPLNYHIIFFGVFFPLVAILEFLFLTKNIPLILSCFAGTIFFEGFFWFLLNWYFPNSFSELLKGPKGKVWWQTKWVKISKDTYIPSTYIIELSLSMILFILA